MWLEKGLCRHHPHVSVFILYLLLTMFLVSSMLRSQADTCLLLAADNHSISPTKQIWILECPLLPLAIFDKMLICSTPILFILGSLRIGSMSYSLVYPQGLVYSPHQIFVK